MRRFRTFSLAFAVLIAAGTITFIWPRENGLSINIDGSPRAQAKNRNAFFDLTKLKVLNRTVLEAKDHYVDPTRLQPKRMLLAGLNALQGAVAPVLVHHREKEQRVVVNVAEKSRGFDISEVDSPWALTNAFRDILGFVQKHLQEDDLDLQEVEYAVVNGMLRTLDPHSLLLTPAVFEEMQMSTRGKFGGLGIVISIRDGHLTIIRPMPGTPAAAAKLERGDRIVKINNESTLNMPLSEAVDRLRGDPGTSVEVWVTRKGNKKSYGAARKVMLVRAVVSIDSVESRMLSGNIGYIKLRSFQGNTEADMRAALKKLGSKKMKGLVLDLRDNPGGLLDQAVRISDAFLDGGTIVTTSSNDANENDVKYASAANTEPPYPMVVLVNGSSASASEIVAGALKNHDRAVVIGQRTFGKGSVQVLYNFHDQSALKLTVAHYVTPGDVSIQGVGIVPDIGIDPMTVDREDMDIAIDEESYLRESDLRDHLTHDSARLKEKPKAVLRYYLPAEMRQRLMEAQPEDQEENAHEDEFLTRFGRALIEKAGDRNRRKMLDSMEAVLSGFREAEMQKTEASLKALGVDWSRGESTGKSAGTPKWQVKATTSAPSNRVKTGEPFELRVSVKNTGDAPAYRLRANTKSDFGLFADRELVFGKVNPGETKQWTATLGVCEGDDESETSKLNKKKKCLLPPFLPTRADIVRVHFEEEYGRVPEPVEVRTEVHALPMPKFAYSINTSEDAAHVLAPNGNIEAGEHATMHLLVRNVGEGGTRKLQANLRNLTGDGVLLQDGRFDLENMAPGEERWVRFTFRVLPEFRRDRAKFEVLVTDLELRESVSETIEVPVGASTASVQAGSYRLALKKGASLRVAPVGDAETLMVQESGTQKVQAFTKVGDYYGIHVVNGGTVWVHKDQAGESAAAKSHQDPSKQLQKLTGAEMVLAHSPPLIEISSEVALVTTKPKLNVQGIVKDNVGVRDMYIYVGGRKVYYKSNRKGKEPTKASFNAELPLHGGLNYISVFARERSDVVSRQSFIVRRDGRDGKRLETPKFDDALFGISGDEGGALEGIR